jgi:hypothetical protein
VNTSVNSAFESHHKRDLRHKSGIESANFLSCWRGHPKLTSIRGTHLSSHEAMASRIALDAPQAAPQEIFAPVIDG